MPRRGNRRGSGKKDKKIKKFTGKNNKDRQQENSDDHKETELATVSQSSSNASATEVKNDDSGWGFFRGGRLETVANLVQREIFEQGKKAADKSSLEKREYPRRSEAANNKRQNNKKIESATESSEVVTKQDHSNNTAVVEYDNDMVVYTKSRTKYFNIFTKPLTKETVEILSRNPSKIPPELYDNISLHEIVLYANSNRNSQNCLGIIEHYENKVKRITSNNDSNSSVNYTKSFIEVFIEQFFPGNYEIHILDVIQSMLFTSVKGHFRKIDPTSGLTPFMLACEVGDYITVGNFIHNSRGKKYYLDHSAVDSEGRDNLTWVMFNGDMHNLRGITQQYKAQNLSVNHQDHKGWTVAHYTSHVNRDVGGTQYSYMHKLSMLISRCEDVRLHLDLNITDNLGLAPIHLAMVNDAHSAYFLIEYLLKNGADINKQIDGLEGMTPLMYGAYYYKNSEYIYKTMQNLLRYGIGGRTWDPLDVASVNYDGVSPIHYIVKNLPLELIKLFITRYNPSLKAVDYKGQTILHYAIASKDIEKIEYVISKLQIKPLSIEKFQNLLASEGYCGSCVDDFVELYIMGNSPHDVDNISQVIDMSSSVVVPRYIQDRPNVSSRPVTRPATATKPVTYYFSDEDSNFDETETIVIHNEDGNGGTIKGWYEDDIITTTLRSLLPNISVPDQTIAFVQSRIDVMVTESGENYYMEYIKQQFSDFIRGAQNGEASVLPINTGSHWILAFCKNYTVGDQEYFKFVLYDSKQIFLENRSVDIDNRKINLLELFSEVLPELCAEIVPENVVWEIIIPELLLPQQRDGVSCGPLVVENACKLSVLSSEDLTKENCENQLQGIHERDVESYRAKHYTHCSSEVLNIYTRNEEHNDNEEDVRQDQVDKPSVYADLEKNASELTNSIIESNDIVDDSNNVVMGDVALELVE